MRFLRPLALCALLASTLALAAPSEYQVEAVFLFNFSQFVEWPAQAFGAADAPFAICVVGEDRFGADLESAVHGENVQGHPLVIKRHRDVADLESCHILFIGDTEAPQFDRIIASLGNRPILTVSGIDRSAERNAVVQFAHENGRIRLRINIGAAKSAGLTISSKLLRPAEIVGGRG